MRRDQVDFCRPVVSSGARFCQRRQIAKSVAANRFICRRIFCVFAGENFLRVRAIGAFAFYHPNADVLNGGRPGYRPFDQSNAYYDEAVPARDRQQIAPRRHRNAR
jgi:hypothetical protein